MALTTKEQLKQVLDAVFNNGNPDTEYINQGDYTAVQMYLNTISRTAEILERDENTNKYIIAILQKENHPYTQEGELEYYTCKDIKDAILTTVDDLKEYNRGISSYIPMKQYIRNICVFLGVSMSENFDKENPLVYEDICNIIRKYCTLNNKGLAYWGRYDVSNTPTYKSYVPVMCVVDIAILFNSLRLFSVSRELFQYGELFTARVYNQGGTAMMNFVQYLPQVGDLFTFQSRSEYFKNLKSFFSSLLRADIMVDNINISYGSEIDFTNSIVLTSLYSNGDYAVCYVLPKSCIFLQGLSSSDTTDFVCKNPTRSFYVFNNIEDYNYIKITSQYNTTTQQFTNTKTIVHRVKSINNYTQYINDVDNTYSNIKCDKYYKTYMTDVYVGTSNPWIYSPIDKFSLLDGNTSYTNLLFLNYENLIKSGIKPEWNSFIIKLKNTENIDITENDFIFGYITRENGADKNRITIIKNAKSTSLTCNKVLGTVNTSIVAVKRKRYNTDYVDIAPIVITGTNGYNINFKNSRTITFGDSLEFYTYEADSLYSLNNITLIDHSTSDTFNINSPSTAANDTRGIYFTNLGELESLSGESLNGLTLIEGSSYPTSVIDLASFISTYPNAIYRGINNPYYENDELITTNLHTDTWVACNVTKNIPVDQSSAQDPNVDDLTDDEVEDVLKNIDDSTDNKDEEDDPESKDETKPGENEGNSTIPTIDDVFKYNMSQFQTQWVLSEAEFQALGLLINSSDFLTAIAMKIAGILGIDPLSGIVSVQVAPISLTPNIDTTLKTMVIRGIEMTGEVEFLDTGTKSVTVQGYTLSENVKEFDLGEKDISSYFNSYLDLVDTQMTLYLPFVGNIDLDIRDFYEGSIWIKGFAESYTGQIVYYIIAKKEDQTRIVSTVTGNCYSTIPLNQDSYGSFMNSFTRG